MYTESMFNIIISDCTFLFYNVYLILKSANKTLYSTIPGRHV